MGFYDNPDIDDSAKNSEESELSLRQIFSRKSGFVCRPVNPDYGVDFHVELILNAGQASNWHFPIQLKSISEPNWINEGQEISYQFKTSRLGYLLRHIPGVIVLYDVASQKFYYDLVSEIVTRLYSELGHRWERNTTVNIKIPKANELNAASVATIHNKYVDIFHRLSRMQLSYGDQYGIPKPAFKTGGESYDFNSGDSIMAFLDKHGTNLLIEYDFSIVANLIDKLTERQICSNTKLSCIAAVVYSEGGRYELSEVHCRRALRRKDIAEDDIPMVMFVSLKNRFRMGEIEAQQLVMEVENLKSMRLSDQSALTIAVNLVQFKLSLIGPEQGVSDRFREDILAIYEGILNCSVSKKVKILLMLWNCDNFSLYINIFFRSSYGPIQSANSDALKAKLFKAILALDKQLFDFLDVVRDENSEFNIRLLQGFALQIRVKHIVDRELLCLRINPTISNFRGFESTLAGYINFSLTSYRFLLDEGYRHAAYMSLCYALELMELARRKLKISLEVDVESLYSDKETIEQDMNGDVYTVGIPSLLNNSAGFDDKGENGELSDEQFARLRQLIARMKTTPDEFVINLVGEINSFQEFFRRCSNPDIDILSIYYEPDNPANYYLSPVRYVLINKRTNMQSDIHLDISYLLSNWGY